MKARNRTRARSMIAVRAYAALVVISLLVGMSSMAYGNLAQNPSMEGSFVTQGSLGDVAEDWIGWADRQYSLEGEFSESGTARTGSKSQRIAWDDPYNTSPTGGSSFGYEGIYQQIHSLQPGQLYRAAAWFKGTMSGSFPVEGVSSFSLYGAIGADPDGGTAVSHWHWIWMQWTYPHFGDIVFPAWARLGTVFSANGDTARVYVSMRGNASNYTHYYDPWEGDVWQAHPWHVDCYIDDVVVEPTEIGPGSSVQATSPIPANGADRCVVTITVVDDSGQPLQGVPPSEIVVACTGSDNTIVGPTSATDANGVATAYITSRVGETKTISATVFGGLLSDTPAVEFTGSFGPFWYVDTDAGGANNGSSWADAFNDLQDALAIARSGDEIWVAQGTYAPDTYAPGSRGGTFQLVDGVAVRGGYAGFGQPDPDARNVTAYETILTGDLIGDDGADFANNDENSYHVVTGSGTDATAILDGVTITAGNADGSSSMQNNGGGMLVNNGSPTLTYCTFTANAGEYGAALGNYNASPSLTNCTFASNRADTGGGGMANDAGAAPTVTDCEFAGNSSEYGGAMRNYNASPTVTNCTFSTNSADYGGAVRNYAGAVELRDCTFTDNAAATHGGGVFNEASNATVTGCTFSGNSAFHGGGMYGYEASSPTVTNCEFTGNSAEEAGGGMFNGGAGSPTVADCTFSGNSAAVGGAMLNDETSVPVTNCTFSGNSAEYYGGGIFEYANSPLVANCVFSSNSAGEGGGAIAIQNGAGTVANCTLSNNSAAGGNALICDSEGQPSNISVANCILWDGGGEIANEDGSTIAVTYSDVQGGWAGSGNVNANPLFFGPGDDDYRLGAGSPCIDAGDNGAVPAGITTDLDGLARFSDDPASADTGHGTAPIVDMGAYEFGSSVTTVAVYRFWSDSSGHHFYTISETEKNKLIDDYSATWAYEDVAYYALSDDSDPDSRAVYRFWSDRYKGHFYTIGESEKDKLVGTYSHVWTYEGPAFYAYAEGNQPVGTSAVYRFWSERHNGHFYTISESEKNKLVDQYADVWAYEGIAWYAYE